ncbi:class I histocompatibility antigen, F10 alpha chain-like, partial [Manacus vitellinus]|uniref:class I histocompatibility antigen, F10 alpha chain-like n=1 Tax=Manacus vitellinus TaxID=328815 RepID=UPI00115DE85B
QASFWLSQLSQFPLSFTCEPPQPPSLSPWASPAPPNVHVPPVLHSLRYLRVVVSEPSPGLPQYVGVGYVDGIPFASYSSERGRVEPRTLWMAAGAEPGYWDTETWISKMYQHEDPAHLKMLQIRYNQSGGLHTLQRDFSCELLSDGNVRGSFRQGFDGQDFLSFELGSRSFVAADGAAQITKRRWESDGTMVERLTNYLEHICPEALQKHVQYGQEALERKGGGRIPMGMGNLGMWRRSGNALFLPPGPGPRHKMARGRARVPAIDWCCAPSPSPSAALIWSTRAGIPPSSCRAGSGASARRR